MKKAAPRSFQTFLNNRQPRIEKLLRKKLQIISSRGPKKLIEALKYVLDGGKRIRGLLIYAAGESFGANIKMLDSPVCALEMIHAFSLVHDDLPAMDNDKLRRGKLTCHLAFDEATAILVGDALAIGAFEVIGRDRFLSPEKKAQIIEILAAASGVCGMTGGQYLDLHQSGKKPTKKQIEKMYLLKTGALINAALRIGGVVASLNKQKLALLGEFSRNLGLAFQIQDDILNIESNALTLGKNVGTDKKQNKITYPTLFGINAAKAKVAKLMHETHEILRKLKIQDDALSNLIDYVKKRNY
jgi:geranylgeranyl pyrophosphate synthase